MRGRSFLKFSNYVGMPILGYEKEISSILRKLESQKGRGVKVLGGKSKSLSSSWLDKEIQRLKCFANYNSAMSIVKGKGKGVGTQRKGFCRSLGCFRLRVSLVALGQRFFALGLWGCFLLRVFLSFFGLPAP